MEICLTAGEWVEDRRATATAWLARREPETKTVWTFLAQGAAGGAIGYFILVAGAALVYPVDWNIIYCLFVPVFLAFGALFGSFAAVFVWLTGRLLKRRLNFFVRAVVVSGVFAAISILQFYLTTGSGGLGGLQGSQELQTPQWPIAWIMGSILIMKLPIVLLAGSRIRPCRLLLSGAGPRSPRLNVGSWLAFPAGFVLRVISIFGLLEALMLLATWIANGGAGSNWIPPRNGFPAIALAILYFAASSYLSIRTPRKFFLPPTIILMNVPLASLVVVLGRVAARGFDLQSYLFYLLLAPICVWVVYTLGRLIAPDPPLVAAESVRRLAGSWTQRNSTLKLSSGGAY
jgi:hypothetical protein